MLWNDALESLVGDFGLTPETVYLLPLVPLVEVMWADGSLQRSEIDVFHECLTRHVDHLFHLADDQAVVTVAEAQRFARDLFKAPHDPLKLRRLRELAVQALNLDPDVEQRRTVMDNCLDLAAIAVSRYPYGRRERVMAAEKQVLHELFETLNLKSSRANA